MDKRKRPHSEEHKRKISEAHKAFGEKHWMKRPEVIARAKATKASKPPVCYWLGKKRPDITGQNHYLWNGKTPIIEQIRKCVEYYRWRSEVFERDNYTCVLCNAKGVYLHADHIKQFSFIIHEKDIKTLEDALDCQELWDVNNGRTLCKPCHRSIPAYSYNGGRKITFIKEKVY